MTHLERLRELRALGEKLLATPEKVCMKSWACEDSHCGTVACLGGWAALHPVFNEEGLSIQHSIFGAAVPVYGGDSGFYALEEFFGLDNEDAEKIFGATYATEDIGEWGDYEYADNTLERALYYLDDVIAMRVETEGEVG